MYMKFILQGSRQFNVRKKNRDKQYWKCLFNCFKNLSLKLLKKVKHNVIQCPECVSLFSSVYPTLYFSMYPVFCVNNIHKMYKDYQNTIEFERGGGKRFFPSLVSNVSLWKHRKLVSRPRPQIWSLYWTLTHPYSFRRCSAVTQRECLNSPHLCIQNIKIITDIIKATSSILYKSISSLVS